MESPLKIIFLSCRQLSELRLNEIIMISQTIRSSLTTLFGMNIQHLSIVQHNNNKYFIVIGSTSIILVSERFEKLEAKIAFQCIDRLIVSSKDIYLFQIHMNGKRPQNVPAKMNLHCIERRLLIKFIRFGWKTDYMFKYQEVRELPTYKAEFKDYAYKIEMLVSPRIDLIELQERNFKMHTFLGYNIFLQSAYSCTKKGVYCDQKMGREFNLQISETLPIEVLHHIGERRELQYYAETYMKEVCMNFPYWIIESSIYFKRRNLYDDLAEWSCWQVIAKSAQRDIIVIILRRKFLPPLFETFNDIILSYYGPKGFKDFRAPKNPDEEGEQQEELQEVEEGAEEDEEEEGEEGGKKKNQAEEYKKALAQIYDDQYVQHHVREAADTIFFSEISPLDPSYKDFIKIMCDNLIYDEDCMRYLQQKHNMYPKYKEQVDHIIQSIKDLMAKPDQMTAEKMPTDIIKKVVSDSRSAIEEDEVKQVETRRVFTYKFSRYLAYALDGGIESDFTFNTFIEKLLLLNQKSELSKLIDFCLFPMSESTGTLTDFMIDENYKKISKIVQQRYIFNERVMSSLLETNLFREELLKKDATQQQYVELLIHLLLNGKMCRESVCKHIINYQVQSKEMTEQIVNLLKGLVSPLLIVYQSDNLKISTLAAVALYNMCANAKEFKYSVMKENGLSLIMKKIVESQIHQNLLHYSLRLVYSLMGIVQNIETFVQLGLLEQLFKILEGNPIPGAVYSLQVETMCLKIITVFKCTSKDQSNTDRLDLFIQIVVRVSDVYMTSYAQIDLLKAEALNTIFRILSIRQDDEEVTLKILNDLVPYLLDLTKEVLDKQLKISLIKILCLIAKNTPSVKKEWSKEEILQNIHQYEKEQIPGADFLMKVLTEDK